MLQLFSLCGKALVFIFILLEQVECMEYRNQLYSITPNPSLPADYESSASIVLIASAPDVCSISCLSTEGCQAFVYNENLPQCLLYETTFTEVSSVSQSNGLMYGEIVPEKPSTAPPSAASPSTAKPLMGAAPLPGHFSRVEADCQAHYENGETTPGVYIIQPINDTESFTVWCDFDAGHGWTVIQKRLDGSVDFYRNWTEYKSGFGNKDGEYWIGNDNLHALTQTNFMLNVFMRTWDNKEGHANYTTFTVNDEGDCYRLNVSDYSGNAGDGLAAVNGHNGQCFTTKDYGPKQSCATAWKGAWWYNSCFHSNLNSVYTSGNTISNSNCIWTGDFKKALHYIVMRVTREPDFEKYKSLTLTTVSLNRS